MWQACPIFAEADQVRRASWEDFGDPGPVDPAPFAYPIKDFYRTDPISRASETMARCSAIGLPSQRQPAPARIGTLG
jgi:NADH-quinone oxidoreductase subunit G